MSNGRTLRIEHNYEEGTRLYGTRREDGLYNALRSQGWLCRRSAGDFRLQGSVDKPSKDGAIERTANYLRGLGFAVEVDIDNTMRAMEEAEADREQRADDRADRLGRRAGRLASEADARRGKADRISERFYMGQPILVGHHSERGARRDQERIHDNMFKAIELDKQAALTADRADSAARHMQHRYSPVTVANRIKTLETEQRRVQRDLDGYTRNFRNGRGEIHYVEKHGPATGADRERLLVEAEHIAEKLRYWRQIRDEQVADGKATSYGPGDVAKGDLVKYDSTWYPVVRVNKVSVTIPSIIGCSWTDTAPFHKLRAVARQGTDEWRKAAVESLADVRDMARAHKSLIGLASALAELDSEPELTANEPQANFVPETGDKVEEQAMTVETPSLFGNDITPTVETPGLFDDTPTLAVAPATRKPARTVRNDTPAPRQAASGELFAIQLTEGDPTNGFGLAIA